MLLKSRIKSVGLASQSGFSVEAQFDCATQTPRVTTLRQNIKEAGEEEEEEEEDEEEEEEEEVYFELSCCFRQSWLVFKIFILPN